MIEKNQETLDPDHPRDIIDHYLLNGQQKDDPDREYIDVSWLNMRRTTIIVNT